MTFGLAQLAGVCETYRVPTLGKSFAFRLYRLVQHDQDNKVWDLAEDLYTVSVCCVVPPTNVEGIGTTLATIQRVLEPIFQGFDDQLVIGDEPALRAIARQKFPWLKRWCAAYGSNTCADFADHLFTQQLWRKLAPEYGLVPVRVEVRCPTKAAARVSMPESSWPMLQEWARGACVAPPYEERSLVSFEIEAPFK